MREVVVVSGVRTAIGTYGGSLKDVPPTELAALVVRELDVLVHELVREQLLVELVRVVLDDLRVDRAVEVVAPTGNGDGPRRAACRMGRRLLPGDRQLQRLERRAHRGRRARVRPRRHPLHRLHLRAAERRARLEELREKPEFRSQNSA